MAGRYGENWTRNVIDGWFRSGPHHRTDLPEWADNLPGLCQTLTGLSHGSETARLLATRVWRWLRDQLQLWTATAQSRIRQPQLETLSAPPVRLLEAADDRFRDEITEALHAYGDNVLECLIPALRLADTTRATGLDTLARDCANRLSAIVARPLRTQDDWSIDWTGCGCDICDTLQTFLASRSQRTFEWPLQTDRRQHVHTKIDLAELPVRHQTRRQGRPYTLVLTKTDEQFTRATYARQRAEAELAWLPLDTG